MLTGLDILMRLTAASYLMLCVSEQLPVLDNEMFHSIKPGLSAYADSPEMVSSLSNVINFIEPREKGPAGSALWPETLSIVALRRDRITDENK